MRKHVLLISMLLVSLLFVCSCSGGEPQSYSDPAATISVKINQDFIIALEANATTGFAWEASFDQSMLQLVSQDYVPDEHEEGMVGVGGTDHLRFKALKAGNTAIELTYSQPWAEGESESDQHLNFKVEIK